MNLLITRCLTQIEKNLNESVVKMRGFDENIFHKMLAKSLKPTVKSDNLLTNN